MTEPHYNDTLKIVREGNQGILLFTMTTLDSYVGRGSATIGIGIKLEELENRLSSLKWDETVDAVIVCGDDSQIRSARTKNPMDHLVFDQLKAGNHVVHGTHGGRYMTSVVESNVIDWKYVAIFPMALIENSAKKIRILTMVCLFGCGILGFGVSCYLTGKNYNPLKTLLDTFGRHSEGEIGDQDNVYQWLNSQMDQFFQKHIDANLLIKSNQKSLKDYYLIQLLQDYYYGDGQDLDRYGIRFNSDVNVVVLFEPAGLGGGEEAALHRFIIMNIFGEMCQDHFNVEMVELGERVAAITNLPDMSEEFMELLKDKVESLQAMTQESFQFSSLAFIGGACQGLEGIHTSYLQAASLEEYVVLLDTDLIVYDDVKNIQLHYDYSMEAEQRIINAIEAGDSRQAGKLMLQIFDRNLSGKVSADSYRHLVYDMVGTLVKGAQLGGYGEVAPMAGFRESGSFIRAFKKKTGVTPGQFKKKF